MFQKKQFCFMMRQSPFNRIPEISVFGWMAYLCFFDVILFLWIPLVLVTSVATYLFQSSAPRHLWGLLCSQALWNKSIQERISFFPNCASTLYSDRSPFQTKWALAQGNCFLILCTSENLALPELNKKLCKIAPFVCLSFWDL